MRGSAMKSKAFMAALLACVTIFSSQAVAESNKVEIPTELDIAAKSGVATVIYGQRGEDCGDAPSFGWTMEEAVTRKPTNGTLSDAGVGKRWSNKCNEEVQVRAVSYTSENGFAGTDAVVFWGNRGDRVIITVVP